MKKIKIYILIFISMLLFSCSNDSSKIEISKDEYNKLKNIKEPKYFKVNSTEYKIYLGSDGHEYYSMAICLIGYSFKIQYFHYIDCQKCLSKDSIKNISYEK